MKSIDVSADPSGMFQVSPTVREIFPQKTCEFAIQFSPVAPNQMYCKQLECYVSYKVSVAVLVQTLGIRKSYFNAKLCSKNWFFCWM